MTRSKTLSISSTTLYIFFFFFSPKTSSNPIFLRVAHTSVTAVPLHESTAGFSSHRRNSQSTHPAWSRLPPVLSWNKARETKTREKEEGGGKRERERASRWNEEGNPAGSWRRSLITGQDEMCFWQEKSRIANKWSGRGGPRVPASRGRDRGAVTLMAEVGRIKHGKSTEKRQFMMVGKKITVW